LLHTLTVFNTLIDYTTSTEGRYCKTTRQKTYLIRTTLSYFANKEVLRIRAYDLKGICLSIGKEEMYTRKIRGREKEKEKKIRGKGERKAEKEQETNGREKERYSGME
jgi:hypothetical protein